MSLTYTWEVTGLRTKTEGANEGSVVQTHWKVTATDEHGHTATFIGATPFSSSNVLSENFVPFEQLTEEIVLSWIKDVIENDIAYKNHIDSRLQKQLDYYHVQEPELPWNSLPSTAPDPITEPGKYDGPPPPGL